MLWHGHAPSLFEEARADAVREFGLGVNALLELDLVAPMIEFFCEFKNPARDDDELVVQSSVVRPAMRTPFVVFVYRVVSTRASKDVAQGRTKQLLMKQSGALLTRVPDVVHARLQELWAYLQSRPRWTEEQIHGVWPATIAIGTP
jgi:acyl-CoA thioester hydrolase